MTTINTESDFLHALTEHPEWKAAVRAQILGEELLMLPVRFNAFVEEQRGVNTEFRDSITELKESIAELKEFNVRQEQFNQRILDDMGILKGDLVGRAAWDRHQDILDQLGFTLVRMLTKNDLNNLANRSDTTGIAGADLRSFFRADLIMEVTDDDGSPQYVAMEASYTADERDTDRVMRNCRFIRQFTGRTAHPVISSIRNTHHVQSLVNYGTVHWFQLTERTSTPTDCCSRLLCFPATSDYPPTRRSYNTIARSPNWNGLMGRVKLVRPVY
jgi:hypothetical protein